MEVHFIKNLKKLNIYLVAVIFLIVFRLILNSSIPLMDKTEARYAEIARIMVETQNWIVPQIDYGVPFWAKPPLSIWLSAFSISSFGTNEFSARLPSLLFAIAICFLIGKYAKRKEKSFFLPAFILLSLPEFLLHAGVVSTDMTLTFSVTLIMLSFWEYINKSGKKYWCYLVFVGIGLGLLAKGPIVIILTAPPLFIWCLITKNLKTVLLKMTWFVGVFIVATIALPWYWFMENQSEGFVDYFIVGEHFKRFFDSSWKGDKYGFIKVQPLGIIWVFLILLSLPWIVVLIHQIIKRKRQIILNNWALFLLLWILWTPFFFTFSRSLIHPYILPVMPPLALLITYWWDVIKKKYMYIYLGLAIPILAFFVYIYAVSTNQLEHFSNSDKYFVESLDSNQPIYHLYKKSYSGQFYSGGQIQSLQPKDIETKINENKAFYLILKETDAKNIDPKLLNQLIMINHNHKKVLYCFSP